MFVLSKECQEAQTLKYRFKRSNSFFYLPNNFGIILQDRTEVKLTFLLNTIQHYISFLITFSP